VSRGLNSQKFMGINETIDVGAQTSNVDLVFKNKTTELVGIV